MNTNNQFPEFDNKIPGKFDKTINESAMSLGQNAVSPEAQGIKQQGPLTSIQQVQGQEKAPVKIGSGTIVSILGVGGMAKVYKIWNEQLEVYRAVKLLTPGSSKDLSKRFETEVKITAKLHHPNIVEIYNVGEWNGLPYIEMELIDGQTLESIISKYGRLPASVCSAIAIQIADALMYAHNQEFLIYGKTYQGIIHRDLKPANIMISKTGALKLMDFGIARPTESGLHTMDGFIVGTLQYLSPEQLDGKDIDKRTDIYSFGAILYEALTGTKTFPQETITNLMKMKAINNYRKFNDYDFQIAPALVKITEKCLQQEKAERFDDASDLLDDLKKAHESFSPDRPGTVIQKYIQNPFGFTLDDYKKKFSPKMLIAAGSVAVILAVAAILYTLSFNKEKPAGETAAGKIAQTAVQQPVPPKEPAKAESLAVVRPPLTAETGQPRPTEETVAPQTAVAVEKKTAPVQPPIKTIPREPARTSPAEQLQKKYETNDLIEIADRACQSGRFSDAVTALKASLNDSPKKSLLLLWAYIELNRLSEARNISRSLQISDAFLDLCKGQLESAAGNSKNALDYYQSSLVKPSIMKDRVSMRNDALYYIAVEHDKHYKASPSAETRLQALTAWNNLKKMYIATPSHPRFKLANEKLATTY